MRNRCLRVLLVSVPGSLMAIAAGAQDAPEFHCIQGDLQRRVVIFYEAGAAVPCEVQYFKDTEAPGQPQVLWSAANQSGYCESQAEAFVEKLEGWGWSCSAATPAETPDATEASEGSEPVDDTDNLAPAGPGED